MEIRPEVNNKKREKRDFSTLILVMVFIVGLSVLLYPIISDWWNRSIQTRAIVEYENALAGLKNEEYSEQFEKAEAYNEALNAVSAPFAAYDSIAGYEEALNVMGNGIMGYIEIEKINVKLPIYHGTSDKVLDRAVGHIEGSSLPIGGESRHSVLSAHRGLPSAKLFTNLDKLVEGDTFTITVLNRLITYEIDQIRIVLPNEFEELAVAKGKDYCTLLTCTPYGINTHRLLVRGHCIDNAQEEQDIIIRSEAFELDSTLLAPIVAAPILLVLLVILLVKYRKKK